MIEINLKEIIENLIDTFLSAGKVSLDLRKKGLIKEIKPDNTPVSNGDIEVNKLVIKKLLELTPNIPIISEETSHNKSSKNLKNFWLVDPIDGTKEYINNKDEFARLFHAVQKVCASEQDKAGVIMVVPAVALEHTNPEDLRATRTIFWHEWVDAAVFGRPIFEEADSNYHHIFSDINREYSSLSLHSLVNINKNLSLQVYCEYYSNFDDYSNYVEYLPSTKEYDPTTAYILGEDPWVSSTNEPMPIYTTSTDSADLDLSFVDPNFDLQFHPKYTDFRSIIVIKWNYRKGSNLYFVYSNNKAVDGHQFNKINQLRDFITFNKYEPWVEVLRDQTFMIKIDYWFEK